MNSRQQKRLNKSKKSQTPESIVKPTKIVEDKLLHLDRLSGIMKGVIEAKEIELMWVLIKKYPKETENFNVAYA